MNPHQNHVEIFEPRSGNPAKCRIFLFSYEVGNVMPTVPIYDLFTYNLNNFVLLHRYFIHLCYYFAIVSAPEFIILFHR